MKNINLLGWKAANGHWPEQGTIDLSFFAQGEATLCEEPGTPDCIGRARALAHALLTLPAELAKDELLGGSKRGYRFARSLPKGVSQQRYEACLAADQARGRRTFTAGWDHTSADYETLLAIGIGGLIHRAKASKAEPRKEDSQDFLDSVVIALEGFSRFIHRFAESAAAQGRSDLAELTAHIATAPPRDFLEAVMLVHYTNMVFVIERRSAMALGRLDQYLYPFYLAAQADGSYSDEAILDILSWLFTKVAELEEVSNICIGGLKPDGSDATNELSYLCLEVTGRVHSPYTNLSARLHDDSPLRFHRACWALIRTGIGFPAIFNDHITVDGLVKHNGVPIEVARDYAMAGCVETFFPGRQPAWSDSRFNMGKILEATVRSAGPTETTSYEAFEAYLFTSLRGSLKVHARMINEAIAAFPVKRFGDPFLSALTRDCIARGRDINDGGAEYDRLHGVGAVGLATLADSLAAIKTVVFDEPSFSFDELRCALEKNFKGSENLRQALLHRGPKYGNADSRVDSIAARVVEVVSTACLDQKLDGGGCLVCLMAANVQNISCGAEVGATPDGRRAGRPLSDAASPHFGRDHNGPTAFLASVAVPDYSRCFCGNVINMKFDPEAFEGEAGLDRLLIISQHMVKHRIPELQFNFSGNDCLLEAQRVPEDHQNLIVRVSGFSGYFVTLDGTVQEDIIRRRMNQTV